jgi:hypothetical protein
MGERRFIGNEAADINAAIVIDPRFFPSPIFIKKIINFGTPSIYFDVRMMQIARSDVSSGSADRLK